MRRREEAEGESRIMGSKRREDFLSREVSWVESGVFTCWEGAAVGFLRSLKKTSEYFLMWEKS